MSYIIGVDPGLSSVGYGIIEIKNERSFYVTHGTITTKAGEPMARRLSLIYREFSAIVAEFQPAQAGIESIFFAKNIKTAIPVAQARGVILLALGERNIPCGEYSPIEIKNAVVGRGRADKTQVQEMVRVILGLEKIPKPNHAADALATALCHHHIGRFRDICQELEEDV
ncbi:MAG: crossover junction endodeoxyribonuclease RuvC [Spirochaetales bacterium]|nr:crossover junction endodeoxyribonuclease RuvC [Spirochaetales bacterium]